MEDKKEANIINSSIQSAFVRITRITSTNSTTRTNATTMAPKNDEQNVTSSPMLSTLHKKETPSHPVILNY